MKALILSTLFLFPNFSFAGGSGSGPGIVGCDGVTKDFDNHCNTTFQSAMFVSFSGNNIVFALKTDALITHEVTTEEDLELSAPEILEAIAESFESSENTWVEI